MAEQDIDPRVLKGCETLLPRLLSFITREAKHAISFTCVSTGTHAGEVVDEWEGIATEDAQVDALAKEILNSGIAYAQNIEARAELLLRATAAGGIAKGVMRFRVPYFAQAPDFTDPQRPEMILNKFLLDTVNKQQTLLNELPRRTTETYEKLISASERTIGTMATRIHELETELRMVYEAWRAEQGVDEETAAAAHEAAETGSIVSELKEMGGAFVKEIVQLNNKPADPAAANSGANGKAA